MIGKSDQWKMLCGFIVFNVPSRSQRGHLETAPPFTVPCGREARYIHRSDWELSPGPSHGSPLRYSCATKAPQKCYEWKSKCTFVNSNNCGSINKNMNRDI